MDDSTLNRTPVVTIASPPEGFKSYAFWAGVVLGAGPLGMVLSLLAAINLPETYVKYAMVAVLIGWVLLCGLGAVMVIANRRRRLGIVLFLGSASSAVSIGGIYMLGLVAIFGLSRQNFWAIILSMSVYGAGAFFYFLTYMVAFPSIASILLIWRRTRRFGQGLLAASVSLWVLYFLVG